MEFYEEVKKDNRGNNNEESNRRNDSFNPEIR